MLLADFLETMTKHLHEIAAVFKNNLDGRTHHDLRPKKAYVERILGSL